MSLESTITNAVSASPTGLTRAELLSKTRHYDTEDNIMRMVGKMLAGRRLLYSSAGRYTCPAQERRAGTPVSSAAAPAGEDSRASDSGAPAETKRRKSREIILDFIGDGHVTAKELMAGCNLSELTVGNHLRTLISEGVIRRTPNPGNRKAPLYGRATTADIIPPAADPAAPVLRYPVGTLKNALTKAQAALDQLAASIREIEELEGQS